MDHSPGTVKHLWLTVTIALHDKEDIECRIQCPKQTLQAGPTQWATGMVSEVTQIEQSDLNRSVRRKKKRVVKMRIGP